jgi:tape measure domain-containing protein
MPFDVAGHTEVAGISVTAEVDTNNAERGLNKLNSGFDSTVKHVGNVGEKLKGTKRELDHTGQSTRRVTSEFHSLNNSSLGGVISHVRNLKSAISDVGGGGGLFGGVLSVTGGNILTSIIGSVTSTLTSGVKAGFDYNRMQEQVALGFKVMLKDGEKARQMMAQLESFAANESPMDVPGVYESAQKLMAMGFQANEVIPVLRAAGDAAAGLGKVGGAAAAKVDQITLALSQMRQKGRVSAEEMNQQLVEAGIPAWRYLGDEIARTDAKFAKFTDEERTAKLQKMAERGLLDARAAVGIIVKGMEKDFDGLGAKISRETASGMESNLGDNFSRLMGTASGPAFNKYKQVLSSLLSASNSEVANKIVGGISTGTGAIFDSMDLILKAATTGDIGGLGLNLVTGIASGIKQNVGVAVDAAKDLGQQVIGGTKEVLGINSPSRVYMELGAMCGLGFSIGLQNSLQQEMTKIVARAPVTRWISSRSVSKFRLNH